MRGSFERSSLGGSIKKISFSRSFKGAPLEGPSWRGIKQLGEGPGSFHSRAKGRRQVVERVLERSCSTEGGPCKESPP